MAVDRRSNTFAASLKFSDHTYLDHFLKLKKDLVLSFKMSIASINMLKLILFTFLLASIQSREDMGQAVASVVEAAENNKGTTGFLLKLQAITWAGLIIKDQVYPSLVAPEININIRNNMEKTALVLPSYELESGQVSSACNAIASKTRAYCKLSSSFPYTSIGGVLIYKVERDGQRTSEKLVIYSYHFRAWWKQNQYCVFLSKSVRDHTILKEIQEGKRPECELAYAEPGKSQWMEFESETAKLEYTMSVSDKSEIIIEIWDQVQTPTLKSYSIIQNSDEL